MTQLQEHELAEQLEEMTLESDEAMKEYAEMTKSRDRGFMSEAYYQKWLVETGRKEQAPVWPRVAELRLRRAQRADASEEDQAILLGLQPFRGCAQAKKRMPPEGQTPKAKRVKVSACTPQPGMKEARIKNGLSACIKHPNGHEQSFFAIKTYALAENLGSWA